MVRRKIEKTAALSLAGLIIILSLVYVPDWKMVGVFQGASLLPRLCYSFFHASLLHAAVNAWCLVSIIFLYEISWHQLLVAFLIAVCVPDFVLYTPLTPTVGSSAVCFALLGINAFNVREKLYYQFCMALYIILGFLVPFINGWIHLYSYLAGLLVGLLVMPLPCRKK